MTDLSIWQDKIVLRTKEGLPISLIKFAKYNEKMNAYLLWFGKQNLQRIFQAYGKIPVRSGQPRIDELKLRYSEFIRMAGLTGSSKCAEDFSSLKFKEKPLGLYQARGVLFLTYVKKAPLFAAAGCLAGDAVIRYSRGRICRKKTMEELYLSSKKTRCGKGFGRIWRKDIPTYIRAFKGEYIGLHPMHKVMQSGVKEVYKLTLEDGKSIKATADHEFLTESGWVPLKYLIAGKHSIMVDNLRKHQRKREPSRDKKKKAVERMITVGKYHLGAREKKDEQGNYRYKYVEVHRAVYEASINNLSIEEYLEKTNIKREAKKLRFVDTKSYCIHHINGDHYDNRIENLVCMTRSDHMKIHTAGYLNFSHGIPHYSAVKSIEKAGKEMTYDIVCEDPHRNFVANGMVVHNCGKTFMVLVSTENQIDKGILAPGKTLICGKLLTIETGWKEDTKRFTDLKANILWAPSYKRKERILKKLEEDADIYIINHDGVIVYEKELAAKGFHKVVVDESTILKSYHGDFTQKGGKFGKALMNVSRNAEWRVVMSGTPAPNGPEDLWGQFKFLDPDGFCLEPSYNDFKNEYMEEIFFGPPDVPGTPSKWVCDKDSAEKVGKVVMPYTYRVNIRDHLDLPPLFISHRKVYMGAEQTNHYLDMAASLATTINDESIDTDTKLVQLLKLRQITGGFIRDAEEIDHPIKDATKLDALDGLLEEIGDEKVIIYAQYQWEIESIESRYKNRGAVSVYGGNDASKNLKNIRLFIENPDAKLIVLHPRSAAHGITLTASHYMIFYSISYSAEENYQCIARIERASQKETMFVYYLLGQLNGDLVKEEYETLAKHIEDKGTIDEIIYEVIELKQRNQEKLIDHKDISASIVRKF